MIWNKPWKLVPHCYKWWCWGFMRCRGQHWNTILYLCHCMSCLTSTCTYSEVISWWASTTVLEFSSQVWELGLNNHIFWQNQTHFMRVQIEFNPDFHLYSIPNSSSEQQEEARQDLCIGVQIFSSSVSRQSANAAVLKLQSTKTTAARVLKHLSISGLWCFAAAWSSGQFI